MGKVKFFPPRGVAEAFRQHCIDNGLTEVTPEDLLRFVDGQYPQDGSEDRPNEIYLRRLLDNSSDNTPGGETSTNKTRFTRVRPNTYRPHNRLT